MLTDLITCTSSKDTHSESGAEEVREKGRGRGNGRGVCENGQSHSNSRCVLLGDEIGEELLLNAIAVCTNITFYACKVRELTLLRIQFIHVSYCFHGGLVILSLIQTILN